jgi:hypothetical protein
MGEGLGEPHTICRATFMVEGLVLSRQLRWSQGTSTGAHVEKSLALKELVFWWGEAGNQKQMGAFHSHDLIKIIKECYKR